MGYADSLLLCEEHFKLISFTTSVLHNCLPSACESVAPTAIYKCLLYHSVLQIDDDACSCSLVALCVFKRVKG